MEFYQNSLGSNYNFVACFWSLQSATRRRPNSIPLVGTQSAAFSSAVNSLENEKNNETIEYQLADRKLSIPGKSKDEEWHLCSFPFCLLAALLGLQPVSQGLGILFEDWFTSIRSFCLAYEVTLRSYADVQVAKWPVEP